MAEFLVSGKVTLDSGPAAAGAKQIGSEMQKMAQSGIAGFEAARQKVVELTKSMGELRSALLQTNDPAAQSKLNAAISQTQQRLQAAKTEMRGMSLESRDTNEKVQLLAASLGVQVPAGIERLIGRLPAVQSALGLAFNATIVVAVGGAIVALFPKIADWIDSLRGVKDVNQELLKQQVELNNLWTFSGKAGSVDALNARINVTTIEVNRLKAALTPELIPTTIMVKGGLAVHTFTEKMKGSSDQVKDWSQSLVTAEKALEELNLALPTAKIKEDNEATKAATEAAKRAAEAAAQFAKHQEELGWQLNQSNAALNVATELTKKYEAAEQEAMAALGATNAVNLAGMKDLPPLIKGIYANYDLMGDAAVEAGKKQIEAAKQAQEQVEKTAQGIESFIDRVFLQAKSLSDVFHQFLMQLLGSFMKWVSREIALAVMGMKQMAGAQAGGGGLFGSILGGLFGIGGTAGAAFAGTGGGSAFSPGSMGTLATLPLGGLSSSSIAAGMPTVIGTGGNVVAGGGIPTAAGGAATGLAGLAQQWATMGPLAKLLTGAGLLGGSMLVGQGFGQGSILKGALGGAALGATSAMMAGLLFTPYGAIAAGVYAAVGALIGWIGKGRAKRKAAEAEQTYEFAANDLYAQYKAWKIDYDTAFQGMQELISSGQQDLTHRGLGGAGQAGANNLTMVIQNEIKALDDLKKQREQSTAAMAGMALPEFAFGGPVSSGGGILAVLHPGEFVMQKSSVDALGTNFLAALNRAPRFSEGGFVEPGRGSASAGRSFTIHNMTMAVYPQRGMTDSEAANMVIRGWRKATMDGAI